MNAVAGTGGGNAKAGGQATGVSGMRSDGGGMRSVNMSGPLPYAIGPQPGAQKEGRKASRSSKLKAAADQVCTLQQTQVIADALHGIAA